MLLIAAILLIAGLFLFFVSVFKDFKEEITEHRLQVAAFALIVLGITAMALFQQFISQWIALTIAILAIVLALLFYPKKKKEEVPEQKPEQLPAEKPEEKKPAPVPIEEKKKSSRRTDAKSVVDDIWFYFKRLGIPALIILLLFLFWPVISELATCLRDRIKCNQVTSAPYSPAPVKTEEVVKKEDFVITGSDSKKVSDYVPKAKSKISGRRRLKIPPIVWKGKGPCNSCPSGRKMRN